MSHTMDCDICDSNHSNQDEFFCPSCVRSQVYLSRLEIAKTLLEKERLSEQITTIVSGAPLAENVDPAILQARSQWQNERINTERNQVKGRVEETKQHVADLKKHLEQMKFEIAQRREKIAARKHALNTIDKAVPIRRRASIGTLSELCDKGITSYANIASRSASTRAFLCREAASLVRLRQRKRQKNGKIIEQFTIAGLVLPDLKEINNVKCTDLTASLTSTTHLLVLVAFYLGVRLPAEITVPHRDYPLPTINTPAQSYLGLKKTPFPGSGSLSSATAPNSSSNSPFSSKHQYQDANNKSTPAYRPRPLFIGSDDRDERVAQFARRDPIAFNFFVEGISLLAWDIAWLCRSQGFSQGTSSWENICDIGRNFHQLVMGQPQSPALMRVLSSRDASQPQQPQNPNVKQLQQLRTPPRRRPSSGASTPSQDGRGTVTQTTFGRLGQASHLSAHSFLGQSNFSEQSRGWKYSKYNLVADALRKLLVTEMKNAEWEILQEQEWDDGGEQFDEAVIVKPKAMESGKGEQDSARSILPATLVAKDMDDRNDIAKDQRQQPGREYKDRSSEPKSTSDRETPPKPKGTSGWTKLKSRNDG